MITPGPIPVASQAPMCLRPEAAHEQSRHSRGNTRISRFIFGSLILEGWYSAATRAGLFFHRPTTAARIGPCRRAVKPFFHGRAGIRSALGPVISQAQGTFGPGLVQPDRRVDTRRKITAVPKKTTAVPKRKLLTGPPGSGRVSVLDAGKDSRLWGRSDGPLFSIVKDLAQNMHSRGVLFRGLCG